MSTITCDTLLCARPATYRIGRHAYCERCARGLADALRDRVGRPILHLARLALEAR